MTTLSTNEATVITHFATTGFTCWNDTAEVPGAWSDAFKQQIADACGISVVGARGVLASLVKKKLFTTTWNDQDKAQWIALSDDGRAMITAHADAPKPAGLSDAVEADEKSSAGKTAARASHADCAHEKSGTAGKKARAACRRERAKADAAE